MRMRASAIKSTAAAEWDHLLLYAGMLVVFGGLLWYKLGSLVGGYSPAEALAAANSSSLSYIFHHPVNAPFYLTAKALSFVHINSLLSVRVAAMLFGLATLAFFFGILRYWHGERTAVLGTILFGASAWFLHVSRYGGPEVLLFGVLALTTCYLWMHRAPNGWAVLASFIMTSIMLYVPGMVVFIVAGTLLQWKNIDRAFKQNLWAVTLGGLILLAALAPLGLAIYHSPEVAKTIVGLPTHGWPMPFDVLKNLANVPLHLFIRGPIDPVHWLGHVPIIDFFTTAMLLLGAYLYIRHARLGRVKVTIGVVIIGWALIGLGGGSTVTVLVPFVYLVAASGIGFMLDRWRAVFPRNVFAQYTGYLLVGLALLAVSWYSLTAYFVAWRHAPETKRIFTVKSVTIKE